MPQTSRKHRRARIATLRIMRLPRLWLDFSSAFWSAANAALPPWPRTPTRWWLKTQFPPQKEKQRTAAQQAPPKDMFAASRRFLALGEVFVFASRFCPWLDPGGIARLISPSTGAIGNPGPVLDSASPGGQNDMLQWPNMSLVAILSGRLWEAARVKANRIWVHMGGWGGSA